MDNQPIMWLIGIAAALILLPAVMRADVIVVAYMDESVIALLDGRSRETLVRFATGPSPHEVRISPDGRYAYVAAGRYVTALDLKTRRVGRQFDLGEHSAHDIRVSHDGKVFWAACARTRVVLEVDAATGKTIKERKTEQDGAWFVEVSRDQRKLYTPNLEGKSISIIDRASGAVKVIPLQNAAYGIDITPDGRFVWVSGTDLTVLDTATDKIVATVKASETATGRLRITRDGKRVVVALAKKLAIFDAQTRKLVTEIALPASPKVLTLSGDDRFAYLTNPEDHSLSIIDLVQHKVIGTQKSGRRPDGIGWAP
jgi:DNA-binding beta-propeller fold protein YncE